MAAATVATPYLISALALGQDGVRPPASGSRSAPSASVAGPSCCWINCPRTDRLSPCATAICPGPRRSRPDKKATGPSTSTTSKMLERKDIHAVIVGTGEFQRVLPCIHACQAGKDIYAEKPLDALYP